MNTHPEKLRNLAQNEYMIDTLYLPVGRALNEAADHIESLEAEVERRTAERDGLAKALRELLDRITPPRPSGYVSLHFPAEQLADARAALAALPKEADDVV